MNQMKKYLHVLTLRLVLLIFLPGLLIACTSQGQGTPSPTESPNSTPSPLALTPTRTSTLPPPTSTQIPSETPATACTYAPAADANVYTRPDLAADVFTVLPAGSATTMTGQTSTGWVGFVPGIAQAANMGPFRLRWVQADPADLTGSCNNLTVFWAPPAGICFDMPMEDTPVYSSPDTSSQVIITLHPEDFAGILGQTSTGWAKIDLGAGNTGNTGLGWVESTTLNMNGPCDNLPAVTS